MGFDHAAFQSDASGMIARWGSSGLLVRSGVPRSCTAAFLDYNPRAAQLNLDGLARILVAATGLAVPPDHEQDVIVLNGSKYSIVTPVKGGRPGGVVYFYDLDVVYISAYP